MSFIIFIDLGRNMVSVSSIGNSYIHSSTVSEKLGTAGRRIYNSIPNTVLKKDYWIDKIAVMGKKCSSAEQRLILGATALMTQPFIDAHNKDVDEKTRKVSVARTIAKVVAGTLTGFAIRKGCIKAIGAWSKRAGDVDKAGRLVTLTKLNTFFTPKGKLANNPDAFEQYKNALGTIVALVVMMFTNFLIDAPLTKWITNLLIDDDKPKSGGKK